MFFIVNMRWFSRQASSVKIYRRLTRNIYLIKLWWKCMFCLWSGRQCISLNFLLFKTQPKGEDSFVFPGIGSAQTTFDGTWTTGGVTYLYDNNSVVVKVPNNNVSRMTCFYIGMYFNCFIKIKYLHNTCTTNEKHNVCLVVRVVWNPRSRVNNIISMLNKLI